MRIYTDLTRQLSFLTNNYKYEPGEDPDNKCILIPKYRAAGRVAPDGKRYPIRELKVDEKDLVPVRSIVTKFSKPDIVTPDCISTKFKDFTPGSAIGISFGTSLTEAITQSALGLKHGGHERVLVQDGILYAPKAVKNIREEGKFMVLECNSGGDLKYPRPENLVLTPEKSFKGGDIIGTAYNTSSPISKLNSLIKLLRATGNRGKRYFEKDDIIVSECYAYESGVITYKEDKSGDIVVEIGGTRYTYNPQCMYYYPEGTKIEKYQRFCSGVADMGRVVSRLGNNLQDIYIIFRNQFYTLVDGDFVKEGLNPHSTQEELCEMLFISLLNVEYDPDDDKIQGIQYLGTNSGIMNNNSFYTMLSYGYSSRVVSKALRGEAVLKDDIMTDTVLGMLIHNKLDE